MKTILSILALMAVSGCSLGPAPVKQPILSPQEQALIISEGQALLKKYPENTTFEIPQSEWPNSLALLKPMQIRRYGEGIGVLLWKWVSKETGFMITIPGYFPSNTSNSTYEKVSEGLYWYHISG